MDDDELQQYAMQLASLSVVPMALQAAIELGVFEIIQESGPQARLCSSEIASKLAACNNPDAPLVLDRILTLLSSHCILTCSCDHSNNQPGVYHKSYGLAPVAKFFIKNNNKYGGSLSPFLSMIQHKAMMDMWYELKGAVVGGGIPFEKAHGMNAMEYVGKDANFGELFKASMRDFNPLLMDSILQGYHGFQGLTSLVDVGGGDGSILRTILSKYPNIKGINYDVSHVIQNAPSSLGIEHVAGDMFVSIPRGDAIFMKWILHGWDDEQCTKILRNCFEALPAKGKVIVVDMVVPEMPEPNNVAAQCLFQFHLYMTSMNPQGKERTEREFLSLAKQAGFSHVRVAFCACVFSVVEFVKDL